MEILDMYVFFMIAWNSTKTAKISLVYRKRLYKTSWYDNDEMDSEKIKEISETKIKYMCMLQYVNVMSVELLSFQLRIKQPLTFYNH